MTDRTPVSAIVLTGVPRNRSLADADKKNTFDIMRFLSTRLKPKPFEVYDVYEVDVSGGEGYRRPRMRGWAE